MATAPKQYLFVSNRTVNVGSTLGHSIQFEKGVPTHVPQRLHALVMEKGIMPCDAAGKPLDPSQVDDPSPVSAVVLAPEETEERAAKILEVIQAIVKRNNSKDFSAGNVPNSVAVTAALGWKVDAKEIRPVWDKFKAQE